MLHGAGVQERADRDARRRPRPGRGGLGVGGLRHLGATVHGHLPAGGPRRGEEGVHGAAARAGLGDEGRQRPRPRGRVGSGDQRAAEAAGARVHRSGQEGGSHAAHRRRGAHRRRLRQGELHRPHGVRRHDPGYADRARGDLRAGDGDHPDGRDRRGPPHRELDAVRAVGLDLHPRHHERVPGDPGARVRDRVRERADDRGGDPAAVRRDEEHRQRPSGGRPAGPRRVHRVEGGLGGLLREGPEGPGDRLTQASRPGMSDGVRLVYSPDLVRYDHGPQHPLKPIRVLLTRELIAAYGMLDGDGVREVPARVASDEELELVHTSRYVETVKAAGRGELGDWWRFGFGPGDNPIFPEMHEASARVAGASLVAAEAVLDGIAEHAFSPAGGLHHAMPERASGVCGYDDPALALAWLLERGGGDAEGTKVNVPLPPGTGDEAGLRAFREVVPPRVREWRPDVLVTQLGCDTHHSDPLAHLGLSTAAYREAAAMLHGLAHEAAGGRWLATGGGGYQWARVVPRAWTLYFAEMAERPLGV